MKSKFILLALLLLIPITANSTNYFFSQSTGVDTNDCLSGNPCKTISKMQTLMDACTSGDDFFLLVGDTWTGERPNPTCAGVSAANPSILGSYWMNGATPTVCTAGDSNCTDKPTITGGYAGDGTGDYGSIPGSVHAGLIQVSANFVDVQNLRIYRSSGNGVNVDGSDVVVQYNTIEESVWSCIKYNNAAGSDGHALTNICDSTVMGRHDEFFGFGSNPIGPGKHPGCIQGINGADNILVEDNEIYDCWGEGMSCSQGGDYCIFRGNIIANTPLYVGGYVNGGLGHVFEHNIIMGNPSGTNEMDGIACALESSSIGNIDNCIIRNNLIVGVDQGIYIGMFSSARTAGKTIGFDIAGNTIVGTNMCFRQPLTATNTTTSYYRNNLCYDGDNDGDGSGEASITTNADVTCDYNHWSQAPDPDCDGVNDAVNGDPSFAYTGDLRTSFSQTNVVTTADLLPSALVTTAGQDLDTTSSTSLNTTNFSQYPLITTNPDSTFDTNLLPRDFDGNTRHATTPYIGAVETASSPPTNITPPWAMTIGGGSPVASCVGATTCVAETYDSHTSTTTDSHADTVTGATIAAGAYQTWRRATTSGQMLWNIPVTNGDFDITFYGHEQYWGDEGAGTCNNTGGLRTFDITIEGSLVFDELDYCKLAGAVNTEVLQQANNITVADGSLDILVTPGSTGADTKPELMAIHVATAAGGDQLTLADSTPSVSFVNHFGDTPATTEFDVCGACGATPSGTGNPVVIDSIDTQPSAGTFANAGNCIAVYTPANATLGSIGTAQFTVADDTGSETCSPTITLIDTGYIRARFSASTDNLYWIFWPAGHGALDTVTPIAANPNNLETSDSNGVVRIDDDRLGPYAGTKGTLYIIDTDSPADNRLKTQIGVQND